MYNIDVQIDSEIYFNFVSTGASECPRMSVMDLGICIHVCVCMLICIYLCKILIAKSKRRKITLLKICT